MNRNGTRLGEEVDTTALTGYFNVNSKTLAETLEGTIGKTRNIVMLSALGVFALGAAAIALFDRSAEGSITAGGWVLMLECIALFIACAYLRFASHFRRAKKQMKRLAERGLDTGGECTALFGDTEIRYAYPDGGSADFAYSSLAAVHETTHLIVFITAKKQVFAVEKARFPREADREIWRLLIDKNPKVRLERLPGETYYGNSR